ncbi:hypothetical protein J3R30DRAFT_3709730 [Lentinula aciculospora]|uniref:Uncharacterized protein n=1 Tax=Lentinula aciculospora TaxID=153920 RepID=A0A9W9DIM0_9AGAR|nr:hypothetical protein J3R30DRAFT_3709730 [Lentinula aciculospora]
MSDSATPKPLPAAREWARSNDGAGSAFNGVERGKRGGGSNRGIPRSGRGAGRGGANFRGRGRGRGSANNGTVTTAVSASTSTVAKPVEAASKPLTTASKGPPKSSETPAVPKATSLGKSGGRRRSSAKTIPQITVPPPSTTSTTITDEINALVQHVRAGALTPNGPITPFTPSHIDWAGDEEEDGSLPDLNDWGVSTSSGEAPKDAETASSGPVMKLNAISPILVEGLKSLPEPKVPEHPGLEAEAKTASPVPSPEPLPSKKASSPGTNSASHSFSLHASLPPKPTSNPTSRTPKNKAAVAVNTRSGNTSRPPRNSRGSRNNLAGTQPGPEPTNDTNHKNPSKPVSGGVSLSTSITALNQGPAVLTPPDSPQKGFTVTDSMHAPKTFKVEPASTGPVQAKVNIPASLNINGNFVAKSGSYVPPHTRNARSTFVPTPAPPPGSSGGLTAEFTFPSLSPSPISGHYPTGPRGPGGSAGESGGSGRLQERFNGRNSAFNGIGFGRNTFNPRNNPAPRHYQQDLNHSTNHFLRDRPVHQPQAQSHSSDPHSSSPHHTPRHTPQHSRDHSASRPVITGDAISKLARTIAGSPQKV